MSSYTGGCEGSLSDRIGGEPCVGFRGVKNCSFNSAPGGAVGDPCSDLLLPFDDSPPRFAPLRASPAAAWRAVPPKRVQSLQWDDRGSPYCGGYDPLRSRGIMLPGARLRRRISVSQRLSRGFLRCCAQGSTSPLRSEWQFWLESADPGVAPDAGGDVSRLLSSSPPPPLCGSRLCALGPVFSQIKTFWRQYNAIRMEELSSGEHTLHLFKGGVRPTPDHHCLRDGGHFRVGCRTVRLLHLLWLDVAMVLVGEQFDGAEQILGASFNTRKSVIQFWIADAADTGLRLRVKEQLTRLVPEGSQLSFILPPAPCTASASPASHDNARRAGAGSPDHHAPREAAPEPGSFAASLVPVTRHQRSSSLPDDVLKHFDGHDGTVKWKVNSPQRAPQVRREMPPGARAPAPPGAGAMLCAEDIFPRPRARARSDTADVERGRSLRRRAEPAQRASSQGADNIDIVSMRKVMSANDMEGFVPDEPLYAHDEPVRQGGMKQVHSWADDLDSEDGFLTRQAVAADSPPGSSAAGSDKSAPPVPTPAVPATSAVLRQLLASYPQLGPQDGGSPLGRINELDTPTPHHADCPGSGPPSLAHSLPVSPAGPLCQTVVQSVLARDTPSPLPSLPTCSPAPIDALTLPQPPRTGAEREGRYDLADLVRPLMDHPSPSPTIKDYLTFLCQQNGVRAAAATTPDADAEADEAAELKDKLSKSRSPRNRRKIRERKIREAADRTRAEMEVWAPVFGVPPETWVSPGTNTVMLRPPGIDDDAWWRFVQACRKDGFAMQSVAHMTEEVLDRLGADTPERRDAVRRAAVRDGPDPHPLGAVLQAMRKARWRPPPPNGGMQLLQVPAQAF